MAAVNSTVLTAIAWIGTRIDRVKARRFFRNLVQGAIAVWFTSDWVIAALDWLDLNLGVRITEGMAIVFAFSAINGLLGLVQRAVRPWPIPRAIMAVIMGGDGVPAYN